MIQRSRGEVITVQGDVADVADVKKIIRETMKKYHTIDFLVNNAGVLSWKPLVEEKIENLHRLIDVNIKGIINTTYSVVPIMEEQNEGGVIVNIASGAGKTGYPNLAVYSATKFAVLGFTQAIAQELIDKNIRVYAVSPGMTATDMTGGEGMPPQKVANRILETISESSGLKPGEDTEIYD
jgi:3-oxoacyl-[acyl-carrier protein] reductase